MATKVDNTQKDINQDAWILNPLERDLSFTIVCPEVGLSAKDVFVES